MSSMGMDKSGNQTLSPLNTWVKITAWTIRSGYASTVITNNTLVMNITGTGNIRFRGSFTSTGLGTQQFRVVKNGSTVLGSAVNTNTTTTISSQSVVSGDTLELQGFSNTGGWDVVQSGAANTFLEFNQLTSNVGLDASQTIGWNATAALLSIRSAAAALIIGWNAAAALSRGGAIGASQTVGWNAQADLYKGVHYTTGASQTIGWNAQADLLHIPNVAAPPTVFSFAEVSVSVHTVDGRIVGDFPCRVISAYNWGRESTEVSTCALDVMTEGAVELVERLRQWVHWITLWHDDTAVWTGPIQSIRIRRSVTSISARDPSTFMWRTRVPITRTFTDTSPARIADTLWRSMNQLHGMRNSPIVLPGVADDAFTVSATADSRFLYQFMDELVKVGLKWTIVAGRPVLGEFPVDPVAELYECDFAVELERRRDGTQTFNDVRVQGQNWAQTAIVELAGLHLQTIVSLDDMFGVSNIQRATQQYARESATLRDELVVPGSASLHPQAPVTMDDLMPGKMFAVHYENISQLMRLDSVTVSGSPDTFDVQVGFVAFVKKPEIATAAGGST